jgi:hypothetical protein
MYFLVTTEILKLSCKACRDGKGIVYRAAALLSRQNTATQDNIVEINAIELQDIIIPAVNEARYIEGAVTCFYVRFKIPEDWLSFDFDQITEEVLTIIGNNDTAYKFNISRITIVRRAQKLRLSHIVHVQQFTRRRE